MAQLRGGISVRAGPPLLPCAWPILFQVDNRTVCFLPQGVVHLWKLKSCTILHHFPDISDGVTSCTKELFVTELLRARMCLQEKGKRC